MNRRQQWCRSCHATICWATTTATGTPIPINYHPDPAGNIILHQDQHGAITATTLGPLELELERIKDPPTELFMPHHATCPEGSDWRKR